MDGLPDKLTFSVEEVSRLVGIGRNAAYELVRTGQLKSISVGSRRIISRQALAVFLGISEDEGSAPAAPRKGPSDGRTEEPSEWVYVVTVKRLRANETVRVEPRNRLSNW